MKNIYQYITESISKKKLEELEYACQTAWNCAEENDYVDPDKTSPEEIEDMAYDILSWGFDDVEDLSDEEYDKCVEILKSFLH